MLSRPERKRFMSFSDRVALHECLKKRLNAKDADGFVSYVEGWDDERVAGLFKCGISSVRRFRQQEFGEMRPGTTLAGLGPLWAELKALKHRIELLEDAKN